MAGPSHKARETVPHTVPTVAAIVRELAVAVVGYTDDVLVEDQRPYGLSYDEIKSELVRRLPVTLWKGPHLGEPTRTTKRQIREIIYSWRQREAEDGRMVRLPMRPRSTRCDRLLPYERRRVLERQRRAKLRLKANRKGETDEKSQNIRA